MITRKSLTRHVLVLILLLGALPVLAQQRTVSGIITDAESAEPLVGASVLLKGTTNGTITDVEGGFKIEVSSPEDILVFSYVGYKTQERPVGNQTTLNVSLETDVTSLNEVVVVGYGTQEREDITGAISSVGAKTLESLPVTTVEGALQGRVPGVQITQNGGVPGGASTVKIRGIATINNDEPLYVIDGIPVQTANQDFRTGTSPLNSINPNDIESIDILKDASAAAIYGSRASAGVILITTKRGTAGKLKVNYQGYVGVSSNENARLDNLLSRDQYYLYASNYLDQLEADALANGNTPAPRPTVFLAPEDSLSGTNFYDQIFEKGLIQNHNVSISGGSQTSNFMISLDYFQQEGTIKNTGFERYTLRINSDHRIGKRLKLGESLNVSYFDRDRIATDNFGVIELASKMSPLLPAYNPNNLGGINQPSTTAFGHEYDNPLVFTDLYSDNQENYNILGNFYAQLELIEGLNFKTEVGINFNYMDVRVYNPEYTLPQPGATRPSSLSHTRDQSVQPIFINSLNYNRSFNDHNVTATVAIEKVTNSFSRLRARGLNLPPTNDANQIDNVDPASLDASGFESDWGLLSYLGRVSYNFRNKYYFTGSLRQDGSSRLAADNRYETFPSFSVGWRLSDEVFLQNVSLISDLKLRGGYGELGNVSSLGNYQTQVPVISSITYVTGVDEELVPGATVMRDANADIRWEVVKQINIGMDLSLLEDKILFTADYFRKETSRMIYAPNYPESAGTRAAARNIGTMENNGIELALTYQNQTGDFRYSFSGNFTKVNNELTKLSFGDSESIATGNTSDQFGDFATSRTQVGYPIGQFYGYIYDGIHQTGDDLSQYPGAQPGDVRYKNINSVDENGDPIIGVPDDIFDSNDRAIIGDPLPDFTYGFTANLWYRNFDFNLFLQGSQGNDIYNVQRQIMEAPMNLFNKTTAVLDAWTPTNTDTEIPRYNVSGSNYVRINSRFVEDGSYMRIKNVTLGYTLPLSLMEKIGVSSVRFYGTAQNLVTFTEYSGLDPEVGAESGSALALGIDNGRITPVPKIFIFGVQVGF